MSEHSKISWTDHTFNPWWGCVKVSPACDHCYAESFSKRVGNDVWGIDAPRRFFGDKHWNEPLKWNKRAQFNGLTEYVFCSSMCDIFEVHPIVQRECGRLATLIPQTSSLTWLLLTKRWNEIKRRASVWKHPNAMMGVTVENQDFTYRITPEVSWISAEPLFDRINIRPFRNTGLLWVIVGGESGSRAREMPLEAAQDLIEQCRELGIRVHFKQTGDVLARKLGLKDKSGKDSSEWPAELQIQEFPAGSTHARD